MGKVKEIKRIEKIEEEARELKKLKQKLKSGQVLSLNLVKSILLHSGILSARNKFRYYNQLLYYNPTVVNPKG